MTAHRRALWELVLAYKSKALSSEVYPIERRESDRRYLASIADLLESLGDRILDSKAYLGLATMQEEAGRRFLAAGTSPVLRFRMLARVVGALATPVVQVAGRSAVSLAPFDRPVDSAAPDQVAQTPTGRPPIPPGSVRALLVERVVLDAARVAAVDKVRRARDLQSLIDSLTLEEAEILSQLSSCGEIELPVGAQLVSFVLKAETSRVVG